MKSFFIFLLISCVCFASKQEAEQSQFEHYLKKANTDKDPDSYYFLSNWYGLEDKTRKNPFLDFDLAFYWAVKYFKTGDCFSNASDQLLYLLRFNLKLDLKQKLVFKYMLLKMRHDEALRKDMSQKEIDSRYNLIEDLKDDLNDSDLTQVNKKINQFKNQWEENKKELYGCSLDEVL